jgi:hypothetical protein
MPRHLPVCLVLVAVLGSAAPARAQPPVAPSPVVFEASAANGRLQGVVTDQGGATIGGVSILAVGATLAAVTTDADGRFALALPSGQYVVRAVREGFISTFRELIHVQTNTTVERHIQLLRADEAAAIAPDAAGPDDSSTDVGGYSETAWLLRHLPRTVLRDEAPDALAAAMTDGPSNATAGRWLDAALDQSTRAASSFFTDTDFSGHVNFVTTQSLTLPGTDASVFQGLPHGSADVVVGAPVGSVGDWSLRGVAAASDLSSWTLLAEYKSRPEQPHALRFGVSYGTQAITPERTASLSVSLPASRSVGGMYLSDRWHAAPALDLSYGLHVDRYDYLASPTLVSPRASARLRVIDRTYLKASVSERAIAPGADEFLPPTSSGVWLPPERTFSMLVDGASMRPERVRREALAIERELGESSPVTVRVGWFSEDTANQLATLFGLDDASEVGHYYVASAGRVRVVGWSASASGRFGPNVRGRIEYSSGRADWGDGPDEARLIGRLAPSVLRTGVERVHDLLTALDVAVPRTGTAITVVYRLDSAFSGADRLDRDPGAAGRLNLELRQPLPYRPFGGTPLELLFAVRTIMHDTDAPGSIYDELLTVQAPLRVTTGLQVRF